MGRWLRVAIVRLVIAGVRSSKCERRQSPSPSRLDKLLQGSSKGQVDPHAAEPVMYAILQLQNAMIVQAGRATPNRDVAMSKRVATHRIGAFEAAELECRRQTETPGYNPICEIAFVLSLMKRRR